VRQYLVSTPNVGNDDDLYRGQRTKMTHACVCLMVNINIETRMVKNKQNSGTTNGTPLLFWSTLPSSYGGDNLGRDIYRVHLSITYQ